MKLDHSLEQFDPSLHLLKMEKQGNEVILTCETRGFFTFLKAICSKLFGDGKYQLPNIRKIDDIQDVLFHAPAGSWRKVNQAIHRYNLKHKEAPLPLLHPYSLHELETVKKEIQQKLSDGKKEEAIKQLKTFRPDHQLLICEEFDKKTFDQLIIDLAVNALLFPEIEEIYAHLNEQKQTENAARNCQALTKLLKDMQFPVSKK